METLARLLDATRRLASVQDETSVVRTIADSAMTVFETPGAAGLEVVEAHKQKDGELATLAHEFRTPAHALAVLDRMTRLAPDEVPQPDHLLVGGGEARLRHGKLALRRQPVDVRDIVRHPRRDCGGGGRPRSRPSCAPDRVPPSRCTAMRPGWKSCATCSTMPLNTVRPTRGSTCRWSTAGRSPRTAPAPASLFIVRLPSPAL